VVVRHPLESSLTAADAALRLRGEDRPFALIGAWAGGGAILGAAPVRVARADEDPFALLDGAPRLPGVGDADAGDAGNAGDAGDAGGGAVGGGWFGYLGYELRHRVEACHPSPFDAAPPAPFALAFYDHVLRLDAAGAWWFEALWTDARAAELERRRTRLSALLAAPPPPAEPFSTRGWRLLPTRAGHEAAVAACRERIHAGDLFQANVCARLDGDLEGSALALFARGVRALAPDRAAYLEGPWGAVASLSPELFLERRGRRVRTAPIKGTADDRASLEASAKDRAENTMIVDLMRNDLGRVCDPGTVEVTALAQARPHTGVWHLVSEVEGDLRDGAGDGALLRATFPPGSVTGAPKVAAMDVISELESSPRGVYTGAIGFASPAWGLELSVAIRTFEVAGGRIRLGVGGGVVADSDPAAEADELDVKASPLLRAIGTATAPVAPRGRAGAPVLRAGPEPVPRPDPAAGIFETILVAGGSPVALDAHLARLAASARVLYGLALPGGVEERIAAAAAAADEGRLRVDLHPDGAIALSGGPVRPPEPVTLRAWTVPAGLGAHKWADRRLLEALEAASPGAEPLLVDADAAVLETSRANLVVLGAGGALLTPPADGRILPGTARARLLADGRVAEAVIRLDDLLAAEAAWVTSALRVRPVAAVDGHPLGVRAWRAA
jgi:para-aminobenzoate synthetase/4-amino-4-deoxychorismate lyase